MSAHSGPLPALTLVLSVVLLVALIVAGAWYLLSAQRRPTPELATIPARDKETWRMPPLALLNRPEWSPSRKFLILALRGYLVVAVILLVVKAIQLAVG